MVHVVLLAEASTGTAGGGGTTRAHSVDERVAAFRELAPDGVTVELVPWAPNDKPLMLELLGRADVIVALFAMSPPPELRWQYFGECLVPLVPELPNLKLINLLSSGFDEYLTSSDVIWLEERGITVANNGGANAVGVSETAGAPADLSARVAVDSRDRFAWSPQTRRDERERRASPAGPA